MKELYRRLSLSLALLLMLSSTVLAQERMVSGTVKDENGDGMPGVNILVKGTASGTASDADGKFNLSVPSNDAVLVFTFIGYGTKEVSVGSRTVVDEVLVPDQTSLDEVIVTGYSVESRREVTGAVSSVKASDLTVVPTGNIEQQLQGRVAGVTVVTNGQPGSTSQIRVRGFGAFGGNEPLYIVDGLPVGSTEFLNPDDIETTTVLKDAAAASIYGARAANGVIVYTTKKGVKGGKTLRVSLDVLGGFTDPGEGIDIMNPADHAKWTWKAFENTGFNAGEPPVYTHPQFGTGSTPQIPDYLLVGSQSGVNGTLDLAAEREKYNVTDFSKDIYQVTTPAEGSGTNWYDAITRTAPLFRGTLGISGNSDKSRYYIGIGVQEQAGILNYQNFRRYSLRVNTEFDLLKNLRLGENVQFTYRQVRLLQGAGGGSGSSDDENDILTAFRMPTIIPIYDEFGGYAGTRAAGFNNPGNPVANLDRQKDNRGFASSGFGNVYLEFEPVPDLVLRSSIGGNFNSFYTWSYFARTYENSENNSAVTYNEGAGQVFGWTFTNTANWKKTFDDHSLDVLVGQEALNTGEGRNMGGQGLNPFSEDRDFVTLSTTTPGSTRTVGSNYFKGVNFTSYFGRINYGFKDKYLVSFVLRRDGSSRFGSENRWGTFPAGSVGWRISEENFLQGSSWIDDLKIRGGYGVMGNSNNVDPNNQYFLYATGVDPASYPIDNSSAAEGYYRSRIGNSAAKWEKAITMNIGFDGSFFNSKLDVVIDFWRKDTEDLLFQVPITVLNGPNATPPFVNVGEMLNRGVDLQILTRGKIANSDYELTVNGGFLHNEIVALNEGATYLQIADADPDFRGIRPIRNQLGQSISSFFGYKVMGLFQSTEEVNAAATQDGAAPGRFRYQDINGDGEITVDDRTWLGSPVPKFTGGITFKIKNFRNFDLEMYMFTSLGNKIFNMSKWYTDFYPSFTGAAIAQRVTGSWTPENGGNSIPIFENNSNFSTNTQSNSYYVEDGSYFRFQNITIGYNLPVATLSRMSLEKLRLFVGLNNIFTITDYDGLDPSVGGDVDFRYGIDIGNFPITRSFTFGLNLGF